MGSNYGGPPAYSADGDDTPNSLRNGSTMRLLTSNDDSPYTTQSVSQSPSLLGGNAGTPPIAACEEVLASIHDLDGAFEKHSTFNTPDGDHADSDLLDKARE